MVPKLDDSARCRITKKAKRHVFTFPFVKNMPCHGGCITTGTSKNRSVWVLENGVTQLKRTLNKRAPLNKEDAAFPFCSRQIPFHPTQTVCCGARQTSFLVGLYQIKWALGPRFFPHRFRRTPEFPCQIKSMFRPNKENTFTPANQTVRYGP